MNKENERQRLIFSCKWNKEREKTWSYTSASIYKELSQYYTLEDFDIEENLWWKIKRKLMVMIHQYDLQNGLLIYNNKRFSKKYGNAPVKVFQFAESPVTDSTMNYIYQDLSVEYLYHMRVQNDPDFAYSGFTSVPLKKLKKRMVQQKKYYEHCAAVFTMGKWIADYMVQECGVPKEKVFSVGAGINVKREMLTDTQKEGNKILFVGKDFERKGGYLVVDAFRRLQEKNEYKYELYIVGPANRPEIEEVKGLNYVGNIPNSQVSHYYNLCDIFCMPSYFEAYGIVLVEALCYGLPCITRQKYAMGEIIKDGDNGYTIDGNDPEQLSVMMKKLLENQEIHERVKKNREEYLANYSWDRVARDMKKIIDQQ